MALHHYIVMPHTGWTSLRMLDFEERRPLWDIARRGRRDVTSTASLGASRGSEAVEMAVDASYEVVASVSEDGPKLLAMDPAVARLLRAALPSAQLEPNRKVFAAVRPAERVARAQDWRLARAETRPVTVRVRDGEGRSVAGARVLAFADPERGIGVARRTRRSGTVSFLVPKDLRQLSQISVEPPPGFSGASLDASPIAADGDITISLVPIDPATQVAALRRWAGALEPAASGSGVRIAVVDTGVRTAHPDLGHVQVAAAGLYDTADDQATPPHPHGTHVAGIIGARGASFQGLAPQADLLSMRVTKPGAKDSDYYSVGLGIEKAAKGDVHLINVSMAARLPSAYLARAAAVAFQNGAVCIAAAGNDGRDGISFPAATKRFLAVTAYADRSMLAAGALELRDVGNVISAVDAQLSRARFSNWGPEADFIGPGVGIISCHAAAGYAADSGTSFAAPAITGLAAAILSGYHAELLSMPKGPQRATAITRALQSRGRDLGFPFETQGVGILHV